MTLNFVESTKAIRPLSKALNDAIGRLPSGPFNFGLYFNKWMYVVSDEQNDGRKRGSPFSCSMTDETKQKDGKKYDETWCRPNVLLDNLEVSLALFNRVNEYFREEPHDVNGKGKFLRVRCRLDGAWSHGAAARLLSFKHKAFEDSGKAYEKLGFSLLTVRARLLSPLVIGLGNEHPTEKGFRFDWNIGVPYIPGTGLKGVARLAYLVNRLNDLDEEEAVRFWERINKGLLEEDVQRFFGCGEDAKHGQEDRRGGIVFFDVYPEELPRLASEIMNCHYKDYLNSKPGERGFRGPTEDQQPNPQKYWAVSPWLDEEQSKPLHFVFRMLITKELACAPQYEQFRIALKDALHVHGLGAKTAVGHGRFSEMSDSATVPVKDEISHDKRVKAVPAPSENDAVQKILMEANLLTPRDKGKVGTIIAKLETLKSDTDRAAVARAIQEKLGRKAFKDLKKKDYLLDLIKKGES